MKKVFSRFDTDGDGRISPRAACRAIAPRPEVGGREVASMMDDLDTDRDGYVDLGEFTAFHGHGRGSASWTPNCAMPLTSTTSTATAASSTPSSARFPVPDRRGSACSWRVGEQSAYTTVRPEWMWWEEVVVWFITGYITIKDMVVTGMPIKIVGVAALTVLLFSEVMCACTYDALTQEIEEIFLFSEETCAQYSWALLYLKVVVWFITGYITIKDMVVTGMPIKIVGVAALTVVLFSEVMCACTYDALTTEIEEIFLFSEETCAQYSWALLYLKLMYYGIKGVRFWRWRCKAVSERFLQWIYTPLPKLGKEYCWIMEQVKSLVKLLLLAIGFH
ncbi:hypothetical protein ZWY2020_038123 [Hordeum vulgare]|nr:hypothetical protein ZWY2020_038123 [Hordeum vulgare]